MTNKEKGQKLAKVIKKYDGWIENGEVIRFPSVWHKEQFEKEWFEK